MELLKNFFKTGKEPEAPIGQPEEMERHFIKPEKENGLAEIKKNYREAIKSREDQYDADVAAKPEIKNQRPLLETHNEIVLGYGAELVRAHALSEEDKAAVYLAIIFHDSGKLASPLLEHHLKGMEYAEKMLDKITPIKQGEEIIAPTPELKEKILNAIMRHMNHPFLVKAKKGERFSEPENEIDKIVFDADMMANVGFKNVCFRLINESYFNEDADAAQGKGITTLEETFNNVMSGVRELGEVVLTGPAKERTSELVEAAEKILEFLKEKNIFREIQDKYSINGEYNFASVKEAPGGVQALKQDLNSAMLKAAKELGIEEKIVKNFIM